MTDDSESDYPDTLPDSITITIPIEELRRLLAAIQTETPVSDCEPVLALVWRLSLVAMPPLERVGVEAWLDELVRGRWQ